MGVFSCNFRDVCVSLHSLAGTQQFVQPGCMLRSGALGQVSWEDLGEPNTILNMQDAEDNEIVSVTGEPKKINWIHESTTALKNVEKYDTSNPEVSAWVGHLVYLIQEQGIAPVLIHCRYGRDRTGIIVAAILMCLGVPDDLIMAEYMMSREAVPHLMELTIKGL